MSLIVGSGRTGTTRTSREPDKSSFLRYISSTTRSKRLAQQTTRSKSRPENYQFPCGAAIQAEAVAPDQSAV